MGTTRNVRVNLEAINGETAAASERDKPQFSALRGIEAVRRTVADASPESARSAPGPANTRGEKH